MLQASPSYCPARTFPWPPEVSLAFMNVENLGCGFNTGLKLRRPWLSSWVLHPNPGLMFAEQIVERHRSGWQGCNLIVTRIL